MQVHDEPHRASATPVREWQNVPDKL